jgi:hypothetical protein
VKFPSVIKSWKAKLHVPAAVLLSGRIFILSFSAVSLPGRRFYAIKSTVYEKQNFSFFMKKRSGNRPVEEGDWKIPQGAA